MFRWLTRKRKPEPVNPGVALAKIGHAQRRALIRARADQMRAEMGMPAVEWPAP
ncbi:hypothetical protein [Novosphingobium guangzhouense]|uniref:hypothetical protein n=1 Tax=Novosphingobium guangzhouense TaxID=1850347 RepID=UPI001473FDA1|nr:hypothetical protein [Novosphingobium guangzhouense]